METQKSSQTQIMLNYGLILGFIGILMNVALYALGKTYEPHWSQAVIGFAIMIAVIILAIKKYKDLNGGYLSLGDALKIGLGIALISGIISVIYSLIFTNFIEPEYYNRMAEIQQQKILEKYPEISDEQLEASMEMGKKFSGPVITSAFALIGSLFFGFIISLIGGAIMKKSNEV